ncbi:hypothetical protein BS50DRAFT_382998 [Corynespora cassiicola Philippines]|uniref:Amidohydrolase-related domain-containing protein n=1 Tax=Corynespora cassiicola Philippines TaxID=1448308 RepID=A0A2T2NPD6_CORCC|nr:hypothetical protein BS50DRAFT_382998 [Corynespora cassiicola Philippines]
MAPSRVLDSHIHLWPATATSDQNHAWMRAGHFLSKQHGIQQYQHASSSGAGGRSPDAFLYVETDRRLDGDAPALPPAAASASASAAQTRDALLAWAQEPIHELRFLRRMLDGDSPEEGDGYAPADARSMAGVVVWAPLHLPTPLLETYLLEAERVMGPRAWSRVVGVRYLLQGPRSGMVAGLAASEAWYANLLLLGRRGWAVDVGVDTHRDGVETLELSVKMIQRVRERERERAGEGEGAPVRFVLNHLCKPDLSEGAAGWASFGRWADALSALAGDGNVFMKLSGAFNEFEPKPTPQDPGEIVAALKPFLDRVRAVFPERLMFGSDWPVCNVGGPKGEDGSWGVWYQVVEKWMEGEALDDKDRDSVWWGAAAKAYGVDIDV